jgi:hypothetical protein
MHGEAEYGVKRLIWQFGAFIAKNRSLDDSCHENEESFWDSVFSFLDIDTFAAICNSLGKSYLSLLSAIQSLAR